MKYHLFLVSKTLRFRIMRKNKDKTLIAHKKTATKLKDFVITKKNIRKEIKLKPLKVFFN